MFYKLFTQKYQWICVLLILFIFSANLFSEGKKEKKSPGSKINTALFKEGDYGLPIVKDTITLSLATRDAFKAEFSLNDNREVWQEIEKRTNVKIDWQAVYGAKDYKQTISVRVAAGTDLPDIFYTHGVTNLDPIKLHNEKLTIKTTDLLKKYAPNIMRHIKEDELIRALMIAPDGQTYSVYPMVKAQKKTIDFTELYYRQDWRKKLGIKEPVTIEDYYEMLLAFKEKDPNGNGEQDEIPWVMRYNVSLMSLGKAYNLVGDGPGFYQENGIVKNHYIAPKYKEYLGFMRKVHDNGLMHKSMILKNNQTNQLVSSNRAGMLQANIGNFQRYEGLIAKAGVDMKEGGYFIAPPVLNKITNKREYNAGSHVSGGHWMVISSACKHPEVAVRWLDYVWGSEEGQTLTNWGFLDDTYTIDKQGKKHFTDKMLNHPKGLTPEQAVWEIGGKPPALSFYTADAFHAHFEKLPKIYNIPLYTKKYFNPEIDIPSVIATIEEAEEYNAIFTDWSTFKEESLIKFVSGTQPLDTFDDYLKKMSQLGIEKLIKIKQKQYDRFKRMTF